MADPILVNVQALADPDKTVVAWVIGRVNVYTRSSPNQNGETSLIAGTVQGLVPVYAPEPDPA